MARDEQVHYGAGGKALRRSRLGRVRSGPYDRPLSGRHAPPELRAAADPRRESWFSKIVGSPARMLKDSASWLVSSFFRKSLPAIGPAPEDDSEANKINDIQENEELETEELYQEEIGDQRLKAIEGSSEPNDIIPRDRPAMTDLADVESYFKEKTLSREEYTRMTELLQSCVVDDHVESKVEEERNKLTNLRNETIQITSVTHPRPGIYNKRQRSNLDGLHGRDPAYNFQTPKHLEFLQLPDDDAGASPAEIAKAYMGGRSQRAPNCLGIQKKPLLNENTPERSVGISSVRRAGPLLTGTGQIDQSTPRNFKFDSSWSNFSRTPHGRSVRKQFQNYPAIVPASPLSSIKTPLNTPIQVESEAKNSLKRRSYVLLEDGITSNRRIRQKLHNRNTENTFRTPENESQISARVTRVPPQSSEAARKILEKLEKMVPSPKDNPDALLAMALDKSPPKLTSNMLKGPALRSLESVAALPFEQQMIHSAERPEQSNIQDIMDKNKSKGKAPLNISDGYAFGEQKSSFVNVSNNTDCVRAKRQANEYTVHVSEKKRGFQMRVPEDSDDEGNGNHTGSLSPSAAPAATSSFNASVSSTHKKDSEQAKLDIPHFGVSKSIAVSKSLPFSTSDPKSLIQSQSTSSSFSFPVIPASTITEPPPTPTIIPSPAKVCTSSATTNGGHPAFNFGASGTTGPVFSFSTNSTTVSEAGKPRYTFNDESRKEASFGSTAVAAAAATSNATSQSKASPFTSAAVITDGNKGSFAALPNGSSSVTFSASTIVDSGKKNSEIGQPSPIKQQKEVTTASVSVSADENKSAAVLVTSNGEVSNGAASGLFGIPNLSNSSSPFTSINNSSTLSASSSSTAIFSATSSKSMSIPPFGEHKTDASSMSFQSSSTTAAVPAAPSIVVVTPSTNEHASTSAFALGSSASSQPTSASAFAFGSSSSNQDASNATSSIFGSGIPASSSPAVSASMILSSKSQATAAPSGSGSAIFSASSASSFGTSGTVVPNFGAGSAGTTASVNQSPLGSSGGAATFASAVIAVSTPSTLFSSGSASFSSGNATTFAGNTMSVGSVSVPSFGSTNNTSGSLFGSGTAPSSVTFGLSVAASSSQTLTSITPSGFGTAAISSQQSASALGNGFGASSGTFAAVFGATAVQSSTQSSAASVFLPSFGTSSLSASSQAPPSMFSTGFGGSSGAASSQATTSSSSSIFSSTFGSSSVLPSSQTNSSNFGSGFGTGSGTSTLTTSAQSTIPFGSTQGAAPSASFSFGGSHSSTSNLFGSSGVSAISSPFGLSASSASTNTFGFGGSGSNSSSGAFAFGAASSPAFPFSSSANSVMCVNPQFGSSSPSSTFQQSTPQMDQMDDSMAEDTQVGTPAPMFGPPSGTMPTMPSFGTQSGPASTFPTFGAQSGTGQSNFLFGSQSTQSTGQPSPFQFGAQQQAPSTANPFAGGVDFSGGAFSLGAGGDKSGRKYIKAKRDKTRRK